jgi:two-component system cell cycle sensor histidine kinase/response regulator CckA
MENGRSANPIKELRIALEKESHERQRLQRQLREALVLLQKTMKDREKFRNLVEDITAVIFATDPKGMIVYISPIIHAFTGMHPEEFIGQDFTAVIHPEDRRRLRNVHERVMSGDLQSIEYRIRHKRHGYCWVRSFSRPLVNDGVFKGLRGVMVDISSLKSAEAAFRESEKKYQTIVEGIEEGYFEVDLKGYLSFVNSPLCRIVGYSRDQLLFTHFRTYFSRATSRYLFRLFNRVFRTGITATNQDFEAVRSDQRVVLEISVSLVSNREGQPTGFRGMLRDITHLRRAEEERQELEEQLHHAQRLEAIGTLAGGIAHDFNNILMGIQGNTSLMLMRTATDNPFVEKLRNVERYVKDGAGLTRQLLDFARTKQRQTAVTDLNEVIRKTADMFGRTKREIAIDTSQLAAAWPVTVNPGQIEQVLMNLFVNAWQAMPEGGRLSIATDDCQLGMKFVHPFGLNPGRYVKIKVRDTGIGMNEAILPRIFNPFFTTKERGRGTGLGLSSAYGIIKNHRGFIKAASQVGKGSVFTIFLPASAAPMQSETETMLEPLHGAGTVMVVDDERFIIEIAGEWLRELGYQVIEASSGQEALALYESKGDTVDLVILDMVMPGMDGGETLNGLLSIDPDAKVLLISGYGLDGRIKEIRRQGCRGFLQKPFTILQLSEKIKSILTETVPTKIGTVRRME